MITRKEKSECWVNASHPLLTIKNPVKETLEKNEVTFGVFLVLASPHVAECLSTFRFDWALVDVEGSATCKCTATAMFQALTGTGVTPLVRIPVSQAHVAEQYLDAGALGVLAPKIETKEDAEKIVRHCRYPPEGSRGVNPYRSKAWYSDVHEYYKKANESVLTIIQLETGKGIENADEILAVKGIDIAFIGPGDLSSSLGVAGQYNHSKMKKSRKKILQLAKENGIWPGIYAHDTEVAKQYIREGFKFIALGSDVKMLRMGAEHVLSKMKSHT